MDLDPCELQAVLAGARAPAGLTREDRVRMLGEFAEAVLEGREPERAAALFVAGGLRSWLREGGNLTRDYWRTAGPQGCTVTEAVLLRRLVEGSSRRATTDDSRPNIGPSSIAEE